MTADLSLISVHSDNLDDFLTGYGQLDADDPVDASAAEMWCPFFTDSGDLRRLIADAFDHGVFVWTRPGAGWSAGVSDLDCDGYAEVWVNLSTRWPTLMSQAEKHWAWVGSGSRSRVLAATEVVHSFVALANRVATQVARMVVECDTVITAWGKRLATSTVVDVSRSHREFPPSKHSRAPLEAP